MFERLLERIAHSDFSKHFVLKGGVLIASIIGVDLRSTMDLDVTIQGYPMNQDAIEKAFLGIVAIPLEDGVTLSLEKVEPIRMKQSIMASACPYLHKWIKCVCL